MRDRELVHVTLLGRALGLVLVVVVTALAARLVWLLLEPLMPVLLSLLGLATIYRFVLGRRR